MFKNRSGIFWRAVFTASVALSAVSGNLMAVGFSGAGTGSAGDPYQITSWAQLQEMNSFLNNEGVHFQLINNLDSQSAEYAVYASSSANDNKGWEPVGDNTTPFRGNFNGNEKIIYDLRINRTDRETDDGYGLFGVIGTGGNIYDIALEDIQVSGATKTGGLAGVITGSTVSASNVKGTVSGAQGTGGLAGYLNGGSITNSYSAATVSGSSNYTGGLVGFSFGESDIESCYATGNVTGSGSNTGGLVGYNQLSAILNSYASGEVNAAGTSGGLVGRNDGGSIMSSFAAGDVTAGAVTNIGGLVGLNTNNDATPGLISKSYALGDVISAGQHIGGLVGANGAGTEIDSSYSIGFTTGVATVGGLCGTNSGTIAESYWDTQRSGQSASAGGAGVSGESTENMMKVTTFTNWDFTTDWDIDEDSSYPYLQWQDGPFMMMVNTLEASELTGLSVTLNGELLSPGANSEVSVYFKWKVELAEDWNSTPAALLSAPGEFSREISGLQTDTSYQFRAIAGVGDDTVEGDIFSFNTPVFEYGQGTSSSPFLISTAQELNLIRGEYLNHDYLQTSDIDLSAFSSGAGWEPIGAPGNEVGPEFSGVPFTGKYDGGGHKISNLFVILNENDMDAAGLFGCISGTATVKNITLESVDVNAPQGISGGLAAFKSSGTVENVTVSGAISGNGAGGLIAANLSGEISDSHSSATVEGRFAGGLLYWNEGVILNSFASGEVYGESDVGGLAGVNYSGRIINSYATGSVSGEDKVGGLVGLNSSGNIEDSYATGNVRGAGNEVEKVGGLLGYISGGSITGCYALGNLEINSLVTVAHNIGGFAGDNEGGIISNSYSTGNILTEGGESSNIGGFIGINRNFGELSSSYSYGSVNGNNAVGGFIGRNTASVSDCYAAGDVEGENQVGGFAGNNESAITNCYSAGRVSGTNNPGGLTGVNSGSVTDSFYDYQISGMADEGKGTPLSTSDMLKENSFTNWDFTTDWDIDEDSSYPYLQWQDGPISMVIKTLSSSDITGKSAKLRGELVNLGFYDTATLNFKWREIDADDWQSTPEEVFASTGIISFTLSNLEVAASYEYKLTASANDKNLTGDAVNFRTLVFPEGEGTEVSPFLITILEQLQGMEDNLSAHYRLENNIDASYTANWNLLIDSGTWDSGIAYSLNDFVEYSGINYYCLEAHISAGSFDGSKWRRTDTLEPGDYLGFSPVGTSDAAFSGSFSGGAYTITGLTINRPDESDIGLFGEASSTAVITDVNLKSVSVKGTFRVGALAGRNFGEIKRAGSSGEVRGEEDTGGLVGYNEEGSIEESYSSVTVRAEGYAGGLVGLNALATISGSYASGDVIGEEGSSQRFLGGLVGENDIGSISDSYATGDVSGIEQVGGLIGSSNGAVTNCYSIGSATGTVNIGGLLGDNGGTVTSSFYNSQTSGMSDTGRGEPRTTAQMHQSATYNDWDFDEIWRMRDGVMYPYHRWEGNRDLYLNEEYSEEVEIGGSVAIKITISPEAFSGILTRLEISEDIPSASVDTANGLLQTGSKSPSDLGMPIRKFRIFDGSDNEITDFSGVPAGSIRIRFSYPEGLTRSEEENLRIVRLGTGGNWVVIPDFELNRSEGWIEGRLSNLSVYSAAVFPHVGISGVYIYPNPYRPGDLIFADSSGGGITIANLPVEETGIRIFNIAGELVDEFTHSGSSDYLWAKAADIASGVYIAVLNNAGDVKTVKFAVVK